MNTQDPTDMGFGCGVTQLIMGSRAIQLVFVAARAKGQPVDGRIAPLPAIDGIVVAFEVAQGRQGVARAGRLLREAVEAASSGGG
jgi:hypothetical protein